MADAILEGKAEAEKAARPDTSTVEGAEQDVSASPIDLSTEQPAVVPVVPAPTRS